MYSSRSHEPNRLIQIDERLFAQINNDPFLVGSYKLEGNTFGCTIGYLNQYVNQLPQDNISDNVKILLQTSNQLVKYEDSIDEITHSTPDIASDLLTKLAEKIHNDIKNLKGDEYLLVPGGWTDATGGHAMIYQYSLDKEGNLLFSINNSGAGLSFHEKKSDKEKALYNPVLTYKIPKKNISEQELTRFIEQTIKVQAVNLHKIDKIKPEYLYGSVFPMLAYVKGEIIKSTTIAPDHWYTGGQLSGTCAQRSLHQMLKARFGSLDEYRRFIYGFKMHSLEDYLANRSVLHDPQQHDLIEQAIKHNLRLLNLEQSKQPGQSLFSQNEKTAGQEQLLGYLAQLNQRQPSQTKSTAQYNNHFVPSTEHTMYLITPIVPQFNEATDEIADEPSDEVTSPLVMNQAQSLLAHMDALLERCGNLQVTHDQALLEQLETFFLNLSLPEENIHEPLLEVYSTLDSDAKKLAFFEKINQLQTLYFDTCQRTIGKNVVLPRMYLVKMSVFSVIAHVDVNRSTMSKDNKHYFDFLKGIITDLTRYPDQSLIANNDPQRDARYKKICGLYRSESNAHDDTSSQDAVMYYRSLLDQATKNTDVKAELEAKYQQKYGNTQSNLHTTIRTEQCTALYYFLEHREELRSDTTFKPLIDAFQLQLEIEKGYTYASNILAKYNLSPYTEVLRIELDLQTDNTLCVKSSPAKKNYNHLEINKALRESKYGWDDTTSAAYAQCFDSASKSKRTDNDIQLVPSDLVLNRYSSDFKTSLDQRPITANELEARELFHLRHDAASQIRLTLDYFNAHLEKCISSDLQRYMEANLFQPGLLLAELTPEQAPVFFKQFDDFLNNGLAFYDKKGQLSQTSVLFIRAAYLVNQYAAQHDPARFAGRLESFYQHLNRCLETTEDPLIKASLHQYRFLTAVTQMKLNPQNTVHLDDALLSYFQMQITRNSKEYLDNDTQFQLQCAKHDMVRFLRNHQHHITLQQVRSIMACLGIVTKEFDHVLGEYPDYTIWGEDNVVCIVDLEQGKVFKNGMAYSNTPLDILNHPVIKQLGLQGLDSCYASLDGKTFLLGQPPTELRFIQGRAQYIIQKKWIDSAGDESWFQLAALTTAQQDALQIDSSGSESSLRTLNLAETIQERDSLAWIHCDKEELLITDARHQPWYRGVPDSNGSGETWTLMDVQKQAVLCSQDTWIHQRLSALESPRFITVAQQGAHYIASLPRYGVECTVDGTTNAIAMDWEGSRYHLQDARISTWGEGIAHLTFSNDAQDICVLPIQQFINTQQRDKTSAYYRLKQDTAAKIPHKIIDEFRKNSKNKSEHWQYTGTEQCLVLKMRKGEPVPQNSAEALYLCYVYLGNNQPEKAWAVLDDCNNRLGGLAGTYDEIRYLNWIINALPRQFKQKKDEPEYSNVMISNPPFVACKLKALALLANFSNQDKSIVFPKPTQDARTVNGLYEGITINQVKAFHQTVNDSIYTLYTLMQSMRREMPVNFMLDDVTRKALLDFYHKQLPDRKDSPKAIGALGYEWVQLHLATLREEYTHLAAKELAGTATAFDKQRKYDIDQFIQHHEGVATIRSDLEYRAINLDLPADIKLNTSMMPWALQRKTVFQLGVFSNLVPNDKNQQHAMSNLSMDVSNNVFLEHFNDYLMIATTPGNAHRERLLEFCRDTLTASRHVKLNQQVSNVPLLCNVLYRVLSSGKPLPEEVTGQYNKYDDLFKYASTLPAPEIKIPQLVDKTEGLLATGRAVWEATPEPSKTVIPAVLSTDLKMKSFKETFSDSLQGIKQQWDAEALRLRNRDHTKTQPEQAGGVLTSEEYVIGEVKYQTLANLRAVANQLDEPMITGLISTTKQALAELNTDQEALIKAILALAKQGPEEPMMKQQWQIDVAAGKRARLDMTQLLTLYFHQDIVRYKTETGLSDSSIQQLHTMLTNYVDQGLCAQQHQRVQAQLIKLDNAHTPTDQDQARYWLAQVLFTDNVVNSIDDPALSLFQLHSDVLLRPQQKEALERLLKTSEEGAYDNVIEKVIMGGGKSKVILPTLAKKKATGNNLVVIEVPPALLDTNFKDLNATSNALFNQTAYRFEFNRDTNCSVTNLDNIYQHLTHVMVNKHYLVTTGDALQSLELKYLELLLTPPSPDVQDYQHVKASWDKQVLSLDKLVSLFKNRADLMIDEVHQGLLLKNKLNFTVGDSSTVPTFIIQNSIDLYKFLKHVKLDGDITLDDVLKNNALLVSTQSFEQACQQLAHELVYHDRSPLKRLVESIDGDDPQLKAQLLQYLQNKGQHIPNCVLNASDDVKEQLAFYKEQINHLLPYTLKRNHGEHYGPSKSQDHSAETRVLAIPYSANNVPNERSRFENCMETTNYTIQSMLLTGITKDLMLLVLDTWQTQARRELYERGSGTLNDTPTATMFRELTKGLDIALGQLDLEDENQISRLHQRLQSNEQMIYDLLKNNVLKNIRTDPSILHSDAYNHVDLVRSCQGMSGTPWNHSTFHQKLQYDSEVARGTDGLVYSGIKAKNSTIRGNDFKDKDQFIHDLFAHCNALDQVRAIIDINATFKGIDNEAVARALALYIQQHPNQFNFPQALQYVLYFNANNELSALRISDNLDSQIPIKIGASDPGTIKNRLNCDPSACFSFYDQSHIVGADIKQSDQARGLVLVDQDTTLDNFLQGSMRMRGLVEGAQCIDIIVPNRLADQSLEQLVESMGANQLRQLQQDNYEAARASMFNVVRADLMRRVLAIQGDDAANQKAQLLAVFKRYFVETQSDDFFNQYGGLAQEQDTKVLLESLQKQLISNWQSMLSIAKKALSNDELDAMSRQLNDLIDKACEPGVCASKQLISNAVVNTQVEVQKEVKVQVQVEQMTRKEVYDPSHKEEYVPWAPHYFEKPWQHPELAIKTLNDICKTTGAEYTPVFDDTIHASKNFYQSYKGQEKYVGMFLKPVHALLFKRIDGKLHCTLLTQQELQQLPSVMDANDKNNCWISTTQHTELMGKIPAEVRNTSEYLDIIEQVRYVNGEFGLLLQKEATRSWMDNQSKEKLDFYEQYLSPCREALPSQVSQMRLLFSINNAVYQFIAQTPFINRDQFDWKQKFPDCQESDIDGYRAVAKVFNEMAAHWDNKDYLNQTWNCSAGAFAYINQYSKKLAALHSLFTNVQTYFERMPTSISIFETLDETQRNAVFQYVLKDDSISGAQADYRLLMQLIKDIPSLKDSSAILAILSEVRFKPFIAENDPIQVNINQYLDKRATFEQLLEGVRIYDEQVPKPKSILSVLDDTQRHVMKKYIPNVDSMSADQVDYHLISQLILEIPLSKYHPEVITMLSEARFVSHLTDKQCVLIAEKSTDSNALRQVFVHAPNDHVILEKIIKNPATDHQLLSDVVKAMTANEHFTAVAKNMLQAEFKCIEPENTNMKSNTVDLPALYCSINELRARALEFQDKKESKIKYSEPSKAVFSLYVVLQHATTQYVDGKIKPEDFKRIVTEATNQYKPSLEPKHGTKDAILNITNYVLLGTNKMLGTKFSDFKTKAHAIKTADDISKNILKTR